MICRTYDGSRSSYEFWQSLKFTLVACFDWDRVKTLPVLDSTEFMPLQYFLDIPREEEEENTNKIDDVIPVDELQSQVDDLISKSGHQSIKAIRRIFGVGDSRARKLLRLR